MRALSRGPDEGSRELGQVAGWVGAGGGRRWSGSRWRRGPFPKRPEGVRLARLFRQAAPRGFWGAGGGPWGLGGASPWSCPSGHGPLARGSVTSAACAPLLMSLSLCALCPALHVPGETSRRSRVRPWSTAFCTPSIRGGSWRQVGGQRQLGVGGSGGPGRCAGFDPGASRQLVLSPGLVGPGSAIPPRAPRRVAPASAIAWLRSL